MEANCGGRRPIRIGTEAIADYLGMPESGAKVGRLLRLGLIPGVTKFGREFVLDEETHIKMMRERARAVA